MNVYYLDKSAPDYDRRVAQILFGEQVSDWRDSTVIKRTLSPFAGRETIYGSTPDANRFFILQSDESGLIALAVTDCESQFNFHCEPVKYERRDWHRFAYAPGKEERENQIAALLAVWQKWLNAATPEIVALPVVEIEHHTLGETPRRVRLAAAEILPPDPATADEDNDSRLPDSYADSYEEKGWRAFLVFEPLENGDERPADAFKIPLAMFSAQRLPIIPKKALPKQLALFG